MKIRPVGTEMLHSEERNVGRTDGETDRHDGGNRRFSQFCESACKLA
jgi:hypothetical protein